MRRASRRTVFVILTIRNEKLPKIAESLFWHLKKGLELWEKLGDILFYAWTSLDRVPMGIEGRTSFF